MILIRYRYDIMMTIFIEYYNTVAFFCGTLNAIDEAIDEINRKQIMQIVMQYLLMF